MPPSLDEPNDTFLTEHSQDTSSGMNNAESSVITAMCQELSQGLTMLTAKTDDDLSLANTSLASWSPGHFTSPPAALSFSSKDTSSTSTSFSTFGIESNVQMFVDL